MLHECCVHVTGMLHLCCSGCCTVGILTAVTTLLAAPPPSDGAWSQPAATVDRHCPAPSPAARRASAPTSACFTTEGGGGGQHRKYNSGGTGGGGSGGGSGGSNGGSGRRQRTHVACSDAPRMSSREGDGRPAYDFATGRHTTLPGPTNPRQCNVAAGTAAGGSGGTQQRNTPAPTNIHTATAGGELRIDDTDGQAYDKQSFLDVYGNLTKWHAARIAVTNGAGSRGSGSLQPAYVSAPSQTRTGSASRELRIDDTDGQAYDKQSFLDVYGNLTKWHAAPRSQQWLMDNI